MKKNPCYSLCNIQNIPYLLPHGQAAADQMRGIQINESGVFLWETLDEVSDRAQLLARFTRRYEASSDKTAQLERDMNDFLNQLFLRHILLSDDEEPVLPGAKSECLFLKIGPVQIKLSGPRQIFAEELLAFQTPECADADLTIVCRHDALLLPKHGNLLIQHPQLCVLETASGYLLQFPQMPQVPAAHLAKDGRFATVCYRPPVNDYDAQHLFHIIRLLFLYAAQKQNGYVLHSASILYREKAWLFSGRSGMGKSTHTNLWQQLYQTPVLNGDLNMLALSDGIPVIYGIPWCGTSGISHTETYPLGGILLLERGSRDLCMDLSADQKILRTSQRLISPTWDASMLQSGLDFLSALAAAIPIGLLKCTRHPSAVTAARQWIDDKM